MAIHGATARHDATGPSPHAPATTPGAVVPALWTRLCAARVAVFLGEDASLLRLLHDNHLADTVRVVAVGFHSHEVGNPAAVAGYALEHVAKLAHLPAHRNASGTARAGLLVVVAGDEAVPSEALAELEALALVAAPDEGPTVLLGARADPASARLVLLEGPSGELALFERSRPRDEPPEGPMHEIRRDARPSHDEVERGVEVAVLGPVEIRGAAESLERHPRLTELVVYLALHPAGVTSAVWSAALWPERRVPLQTVANRLSEARRALGAATDRRPRLRKVADRHLLVETTTDWQRFSALAAPAAGPEAWRRALGLVRGRPFANLPGGQWVTFEGFEAEVEQAVVDCALRAGDAALAGCEPDAATWAAQQGLRAGPYDERLYRLLMRAADAAGNRSGVDAAMRTLGLVLELDGDPVQGVHPETAALYASLTNRAGAIRR